MVPVTRCSDCGAPVAEGDEYCTTCGTHLSSEVPKTTGENECWNCGQLLVADANFCEYCGSDQDPTEDPDTRRCWGCGEVLIVQADRCHGCGEPQPPHGRSREPDYGEWFCFICGAVVHESDDFCTHCGTRIE
jgi:predicted amidophosphoribosyltransferase